MRTLNLVTFAALISSVSIQPALAVDQQKIFAAMQSVVMVRGYNANGGLAYGSGVVVGENKVITNCHVFRTTKEPWVSRGEDSYPITSVKADAWNDLCLVTTFQLPIKPAIIGKSDDLMRGQEIVAIGHSNGTPAPLTSRGTVKALYDDQNHLGKVIRSTAQFRMGASGSGLFNMAGQLVGINTFKTAGTNGSIYYALPIEWLGKLEAKTETSALPISGKALWEEDEDKKPFHMQVAVPESRQDWDKLDAVAKKWTAAEPNSTDAWFALGLAEEHLLQAEAAQKAYLQSVTLDKNNIDALLKVGLFAKNHGDNAAFTRIQQSIGAIDQTLDTEYGKMLDCNQAC